LVNKESEKYLWGIRHLEINWSAAKIAARSHCKNQAGRRNRRRL